MRDERAFGTTTRRSFIAGAATAMTAGFLASCAPQDDAADEGDQAADTAEQAGDAPETTLHQSFCRSQCSCECSYCLHVRDGQIVRTTAGYMPDERYRGICSKGLSQAYRTYSDNRLQYPMKRVGERGEGKFERITWEEAIDTICTKWKEITDEGGLDAFAIKANGGNMGLLNGQMPGTGSWFERFCAATGAALFRPGVDAAYVHAVNCVTGLSQVMGGCLWNHVEEANAIVGWGANPAVSNIQDFHFFLEARDKGIPYIVIDPVSGPCAAMADWYIPINPATDGALAMGILKLILDSGREDKEFCRTATNCTYLVKDEDGKFLRMSDLGVEPTEGDPDPTTGEPTKIDPIAVWDEEAGEAVPFDDAKMPSLEGVAEVKGIAVKTVYNTIKESVAEYDLAKVEDITGVPADTIEKLADIYAEGKVFTPSSYGPNHYQNGTYNFIPMLTMEIMTHNCGLPGTCMHRTYLMPTTLGNYMGATFPTDTAGNPVPGNSRIYMPNKLLDVIQGKYGDEDVPPLKGLYLFADGSISTYPNRQHLLEGIQALDFLVVCDCWMTEGAMYADILLPASYWFEAPDLFNTMMQHPYIMYQDKIIEPLFESKPAFEIHKLIAEGLGLGDFMNLTEEEFLNVWLDTEDARTLGISVESMRENGVMMSLVDDDMATGKDGKFTTADTRATLYRETAIIDNPQGRTEPIDESKERCLYWEPANEADVHNEKREQFPFQVLNEHMRTRNHTGWFDVGILQEYYPEPFARFNTEDAEELGIVEGDTVKLYNDRGYVVMKATISGALPRKMLGVPRGHMKWEFIDGHFTDISNDQYNQCCANNSYNDQIVAVEKM